MKKLNILRVPPEVELMGLDTAEYEPDMYLPEVAVGRRDDRRARRDAVRSEAVLRAARDEVVV